MALTFKTWKFYDYQEALRDLWDTRRSFFEQHGYILWKPKPQKLYSMGPPNDNPRSPDGFVEIPEDALPNMKDPSFIPQRTTLYPARTHNNRDVIVSLLGDDVDGVNTIEVLREIASGLVASVCQNHALPILDFIRCDNLVFGVFPLVGQPFHLPNFNNMAQGLDAICQVLEGLAFLHDRLIAHRDLFPDNILYSVPCGAWPTRRDDRTLPRYYIIDFESSVRFSSDSDPSTRTVTGVPCQGSYHRELAPEMLSSAPYCPFKTDIWQLGMTFLHCFYHLDNFPQIIEALKPMAAKYPHHRPTARAVLDQLNALKISIPPSTLHEPIPPMVYWPPFDVDAFCGYEDEVDN